MAADRVPVQGKSGGPAYDLINEPVQVTPAPYDYWTIQQKAAEAVRAIDRIRR